MVKMSLQMIEMQNELEKLKSTNLGKKAIYHPNKVNEQEVIEETDDKTHEDVIRGLKTAFEEKDETIRIKDKLCKELEKKLEEKTQEYVQLSKVAGQMFNDLKEINEHKDTVKEVESKDKLKTRKK